MSIDESAVARLPEAASASEQALEQSSDPHAKPARRWAKTEQTRATILDAARQVFRRDGFTKANIADIVARSGLSVGSVYHHFSGGKTELFMELWRQLEDVYNKAAADAVHAVKHAGVTDPVTLFQAGARAYLELARDQSGDDRIFRGTDSPPEMDVFSQQMGEKWIGANLAVLRLDDTPRNRMHVRILTWAVVEGERLILELDEPQEIELTITEVLHTIDRIAR